MNKTQQCDAHGGALPCHLCSVREKMSAAIREEEDEQAELQCSLEDMIAFGVLALATHERGIKKRLDVKLPNRLILPLGEILMRAGRYIRENELSKAAPKILIR